MRITDAEVTAAMRRAKKIPGLFRWQEADFIYRLARRKGNLVELGCWMGRTTSILVQAAAVWGAELTTVDAFTPMPNGRQSGSPERWRSNLRGAGLTPPPLLAMTTDEAAEVYDKPISFLFIDAAHDYPAVVRDLAAWGSKVQVGGVVALHDMFFPSIPGVALAVADWWAAERDGNDPRWAFIGLRDFTIAFKRLV